MRGLTRSAVRFASALAASSGLLAGALAAQACPAPLLKRPTVRVAVSIEGCDYLSALAEERHVRATSDCSAIRRAVQGDTTSRVHALSRMMADSLRQIFAHQFGFLDWSQTPPDSAWSATVFLNQPQRGTDGTFQVVLRSPAAADTASEPFPFEKFAVIEHLYHDPKTKQALDTISAQWAAAARDLLERRDGFNRDKLVRLVFGNIPIAKLTQAKLSPDGQIMWALVPVRDSDIRVRSTHRPTFEWHVDKVERGQPPIDDEAVFLLGECTGREGYQCKMLSLRFGGAPFARDEVSGFFNATTQLHPPIALHVVHYRPAAIVCALQGVMPQ